MDHSQDSRIIDLAVRMLFIGLFIYSALLIVTPLAGVVLWGIILCVAVYPLYERLAKMLGGRSALSATFLTLVGLVLTVGPLAASISALIEWGGNLASDLEAGKLGLPPTPQFLKDLPVFDVSSSESLTVLTTHFASSNSVSALTGPATT